jgi:hypothetical protein
MADGLDVRLADAVVSIQRLDGHDWLHPLASGVATIGTPHPIVVRTASGLQYPCDAVCVALPAAVLRHSAATLFTPAVRAGMQNHGFPVSFSSAMLLHRAALMC